MKFGLYIHIPHCLQQCSYCDFATVQNKNLDHILQYMELIKQEISFYRSSILFEQIDSIYLGGGTPSLVPVPALISLLQYIKNSDFTFSSDIEITLEINPGTLTTEEIQTLKDAGFNRFSVGVQTFDESLLSLTQRRHSVDNSRETLQYLKNHKTLFTADILFSLPGQDLKSLAKDLREFLSYDPPHLSAYCLTIPESHPLMKGRAPDQEQVDMYHLIEDSLKQAGLHRYELSNYAQLGHESKHNKIYWQDQTYWGIGMSAHSYFPKELGLSPWGLRFSNPVSFPRYQKWVQSFSQKTTNSHFKITNERSQSLVEELDLHEFLTDYCHISLRMTDGLIEDHMISKLPLHALPLLTQRLKKLQNRQWLETTTKGWTMTAKGRALSNQVFEELTFLKKDIRL